MAKRPAKSAPPAAPEARATRTMKLGDHTFDVPPLPLRIGKFAYPIAFRLTREGFVDRLLASTDAVDVTGQDFNDLVELALLGVQAAGSEMTREQIEDHAIPITDLVDAFFLMRFQTGVWQPVEPAIA